VKAAPRALRRRHVFGGVVVLAAVWSGLATFSLFRVVTDLRTADRALERAAALVRGGEVRSAGSELTRAELALTRANGRLHTSASLDMARSIPLLRQNLQGLDRSVGLTLELTTGGRRLLDAAKSLQGEQGQLDVPLKAGTVPMPALAEVQQQLEDLAFALPGRDQPTTRWLLPPIADLQRSVFGDARQRRTQFVTVARALRLLTEMAGRNGPRRYMIAVANSAEMRGTGGMILSYGVLSSQEGKISLDRFGSVDEIALNQPVPFAGPPDYVARLGSLGPNLYWRNANLAADFTIPGPVMEQMFAQATGLGCDGVIQVDSFGLRAILKGTGPVDVAGVGSVTAENVVALTLNELYTRFPDREVRQEYLGSIAEAVFRKLVSGEFGSLRPLAGALVDAAGQRHIMMHAGRVPTERVVTQLGGDGALPGPGVDFVHLTLQNFSANKLDYYVDTTVRLTGERRPARLSTVKAEITIANAAPVGGHPPYVFGPFDRSLQAGQYRGLATVYLPVGASVSSHSSDGGTTPTTATEGGRTVVSFPVDLQAGRSLHMTLDLVLPPQPPVDYRLILVPSARVRPTRFEVDLQLGGRRIRVGRPLNATLEVSD
jgi:hypothetical protein